jgi:hypothetical protein
METPGVKQLYEELLKAGRTPRDAAREAQQRTGLSAVTGKPINRRMDYKKEYHGQFR